jgi:hypothetical protein
MYRYHKTINDCRQYKYPLPNLPPKEKERAKLPDFGTGKGVKNLGNLIKTK